MKVPKNSALLAAFDEIVNSCQRSLALARLLEYCRSVDEDDLDPETVAMAGSMICEEIEKLQSGVKQIEGGINR